MMVQEPLYHLKQGSFGAYGTKKLSLHQNLKTIQNIVPFALLPTPGKKMSRHQYFGRVRYVSHRFLNEPINLDKARKEPDNDHQQAVCL